MLLRRTAWLILGFFLTFLACKKDDPVIPNEEELITTLKYILKPSIPSDPIEFVFRDLDGQGGQSPEINSGILIKNMNYTGTVELLNETMSPAVIISNEVKEEALSHQVFFRSSSELDLIVDYDDLDSEGNPIGLASICMTGESSSGTLTITLRHEPNKRASGVSSGDITNAGGETDIEVTFDVTIQ